MEKDEIGARLAAERFRLGLTQVQLGELIGRTSQSISNWENDRSRPSAKDLQLLSRLGFDVEFVLVGLDEELQTTL